MLVFSSTLLISAPTDFIVLCLAANAEESAGACVARRAAVREACGGVADAAALHGDGGRRRRGRARARAAAAPRAAQGERVGHPRRLPRTRASSPRRPSGASCARRRGSSSKASSWPSCARSRSPRQVEIIFRCRDARRARSQGREEFRDRPRRVVRARRAARRDSAATSAASSSARPRRRRANAPD